MGPLMAAREDQIAAYLARVVQQKGAARVSAIAASSAGLEGVESAQAKQDKKLAEAAIKAAAKDRAINVEQAAAAEALILPKLRPALEVQDGKFKTDHPLWLMLNEDEALKARLETVMPSIGRIELPGSNDYPYGGTGFVVGKNLVMTNRHVAAIFALGVGVKNLRFKPGRRAGIDFRQEHERPPGAIFHAKKILMIHPFWDMALLQVEGAENAPALKLSTADTNGAETNIATIGYPAFDPRNDADTQNDLFQRIFGVKRLLPGKLGARRNTASFGKVVEATTHDCSSLGGNSGSPVVDFATGRVLALHFGGVEGVANYAVPAWELARDKRVIDAGVVFDATVTGQAGADDWWEHPAQFADKSPNASSPAMTSAPASASSQMQVQTTPDGTMRVTIPIEISVRVGGQQIALGASPPSAAMAAPSTEAMVEPIHDTSYGDRKGYKSNFIDGLDVPMPTPADPSVVASTLDGEPVLHYQNFSIVMHAKRRLALFTASNVTAETRLKEPEGKDYTRRQLTGLREQDREKWFIDPRLDPAYQLTDIFYTNDRGSFDKGHIVRREDVAWGSSFAMLQRANGDSYHITNCSPQVDIFNQSSDGELNWGDLENHVFKAAASERLCQFAGPVLSRNDTVFMGRAPGGERIRVKIPSRYWKLIVANGLDGPMSYAFLLEQDLDDVAFEEFVAAEFKPFMISIADLQELVDLEFPHIVQDSDQFGLAESEELAFRAGIKSKAMT